MSFIQDLENNGVATTENGAISFATTGHKLVDLNFAIPSLRNNLNTHLFDLALGEDKALTLKWLLYLRDIRQGVGERQSFRSLVVHLLDKYPELGVKFVKLHLEEFGRWDDYVYLWDKTTNQEAKKVISDLLSSQLARDLENKDRQAPISLLAKWLPSINTSSREARRLAKKLCQAWHCRSSVYRKRLAALRHYLKVVEVNMTANRWGEIDYAAVPSRANLNYKEAFLRHDEQRRTEYLESLQKGETKINAEATFLHDIVGKYLDPESAYRVKDEDPVLEEMWKAQGKITGFKNTLVVRDGSLSMTASLGNSSRTAQDVADAISLYCAENNQGEFKDKVITFSENPNFINLTGANTLRERINILRREDECANTNIEAVFDLILDTAVRNTTPQEELPGTVLIVSDMEFDEATTSVWDAAIPEITPRLFEVIADKYAQAGYKLPKLVFWNVNSRTNAIPLTQNELGVILLSGFSKHLMSMVMSSELDPYQALVKELEKPRYSAVDDIL